MADAPPPIPVWSEPDHWARLPIRECGEPLVEVVPEPGRIRVRAIYAARQIPGAPEQVRVRAGVWEALRRAAEALPDGAALLVADGHRPLAVQRWLWDEHAAQVRRDQPGLSDAALDDAVREFVASPNASPLAPPPHRTGGAVDVTLADAATGVEWDLGSPFDAPVTEADTRHFEIHGGPSRFVARRRLLYHAMTAAGFTNYHREWWHYDLGNQRWANVARAPEARYGIPEPE